MLNSTRTKGLLKAMHSEKAARMLHFVQITDTHIGSDEGYTLRGRNTYQDAVALVKHLNNELRYPPAFVLHTGDVTDTADAAATQLARRVFEQLRYPIYYTAGNHDSRAALRHYLLDQAPSDAPLYYDFSMDDVQFWVLDTIIPGAVEGHITPEQLAWLEAGLAASRASAAVVVIHHLPLETQVPWHQEKMLIDNWQDFFAVLRPHRQKLRGVLFGHIHRPYTLAHQGIVCSCAPSGSFQLSASPADTEALTDDATPGGYSLITLDGDGIRISHEFVV